MSNLRLCLVFHNHQPVGNFDHVFEQAYQDSYLPFLNVFEPFEDLKISLHTSGPLMEWLNERHPEYLDRVAALVKQGRIEILGGAFYEPILTMIPPRDRVGQISSYSKWLNRRLGCDVQGMWIPERVWEQSLAGDLARADIKFTLLDDYHFKNAGLREEQLHGYYLTEDDGRVLNVFPGSEKMRYLIPFSQIDETIGYLNEVARANPGAIVVFGDDGEKFGTWPETKQHVYGNRWLERFFEALKANKHWIKSTTLRESIESVPPSGRIYLPDGSYREMTEWALPVEQQIEYDSMVRAMEPDARWPRVKRFVRGGFWRNFKVKYPESNEMYARMMHVSALLQQAEQEGKSGEWIEYARRELYRAQCNCGYWHGAFGGIYLPHLRNAVFNHLIAAENLLDKANDHQANWVEATADDYDFDGCQEIRLAGDKVIAWLAPAAGGRIYELDIRSICHNLLATIARRPEPYHQKIRRGVTTDNNTEIALHEKVVFKQAGLDTKLQYDSMMRKSLIDHFYSLETNSHAIVSGEASELGDFANGVYTARLRRNPDRIQIQMHRNGVADGANISITKGVTLDAGSHVLEIAYLLEGLPPNRPFHFAVEMNFAGMPAGIDDRYFHRLDKQRLGHLGNQLGLEYVTDLCLTDEWLGLDVQLSMNRPTNFWTFPVESVSQSEGGFELVHQSVVVMPHWTVRGDADGKWSFVMRMALDTSLAESRMQPMASAVN